MLQLQKVYRYWIQIFNTKSSTKKEKETSLILIGNPLDETLCPFCISTFAPKPVPLIWCFHISGGFLGGAVTVTAEEPGPGVSWS